MGFFYDKKTDTTYPVRIITAITLFIAAIVTTLMAILPLYDVWQKELSGKAKLKEAEWSRQIAIQEANAVKESAKLLGEANITKADYAAQAEILRAKGVAEANKIIGDSLKGNDAYLRYLWIQGLQDGSSEVIYIPTEANLPILEATRKMQK